MFRYQVKPPPKIGRYGVTIGENPGASQYPVPTNQYISQQVFNWIKQAGFSQVRGQLDFSFIWRNQSDTWQNWDWRPLDDMVNKANQLNLRFSFPIRGLPAWGLINPAMQATTEPWFMDDPQTVLTCAAGVVQRYNGVYNIPGYGPLVIADVELGNEQDNIRFTSSTLTLTLGQNVNIGTPYTSLTLQTGAGTALQSGTMLQFGTSGGTGDKILLTAPVNIGDTTISISALNGGPYNPSGSSVTGSSIAIVYQGLRSSPYYEYDGSNGVFNTPPPPPQPARDPYYSQQKLLLVAPALRQYYPWNTFGQIGMGATWWWFDDNYRDFYAGLGSALGLVDYANAHIYSNARDPLTPGGGAHNPGLQTVLTNIATGCAQAGFPNMQLRVTEIGWNVPSDAATYAIQSARYQEVFPIFQANYSQVQQVDIFTISDKASGASIVSGTSFTPAYTYLQNLIASSPDWGPLPIIGEQGRMPYDALTNADNFRVMGSLTVVSDPAGNAGNVNIAGAATITGATSLTGDLTAVNVIATRVSGGVLNPGAASLAQTIATSPANTITTAGGRVARITGAGIATCALQPGTVDGQEITIINLGATSTVTVNMGANLVLTTLLASRAVWDAGTTLWYSK